MRWMTSGVAILAGVMGLTTVAVAGKRGLSPNNNDNPIVLAQAATPAAGATPQSDYILQTCGETVSTGDPQSAMHAVDPAGMISNYMQGIYNRPVELSSIKNVTLLKGATVGKITSVIDNTGRSWYRYDAPPNYIGNDRAVFQAEFEGKRYKIVLELHVFEGPATPGDFGASTCPEPQLIKVTKPAKPTSGASRGITNQWGQTRLITQVNDPVVADLQALATSLLADHAARLPTSFKQQAAK